MKKFLICITIVLSVLILGLFLYTLSLNSKIDTLNQTLAKVAVCDTKTMEELSGEQYKETFYLNQLNNSTTLIIGVIGVALVFAGFFSFKLIEEKFDVINQKYLDKESVFEKKMAELKDDGDLLKNEFKTHKNYFNYVKSKLDDALANIQLIQAEEEFKNERYHLYLIYVFSALDSYLSKYNYFLKFYGKEDEMLITVRNSIESELHLICFKLSIIKEIDFNRVENSEELVNNVSGNLISGIDSEEIKGYVLTILSLIKEKKLK
ncbi:hypothetical protein [Flavobacterium sp. NKUCC04_CG]|uniref:hypothetical protein n=1 Tax=Flavobacterium sp. NKUCC04_CG TaxID=2842121 RepID=UPI001C5B6A12|nr:hypothetical protein [Flavobacterium sp. NKUCC04_CG]MBW3518319.1 hypothetical protein [Flavobacterium sp. NKUCC04_CG]